MQNTFDQWFAKVNGQSIEREDSSNLDQCFDLAFDWCDTLNIPRDAIRHEFAYQIWTLANDTTKQYFDLIPNTADFVPQVGDVGIYDTTVGPAGHVAMENGVGDTTSHNSADQNWDTLHFNKGTDPKTGLLVPYTRLVNHNYNGFLGVLRPKITIPATNTTDVSVDSATFEKLVKNSTEDDAFHAAGFATPEATTQMVKDLEAARDANQASYQAELGKNAELSTQITELQGQVKDLTDTNAGLKTNISQAQGDAATYLAKLQENATADSTAIDAGIKAESDLKDLQGEVNKLASAMHTTYPPITNLIAIYKNMESELADAKSTQDNQPTVTVGFWQSIIDYFKGVK